MRLWGGTPRSCRWRLQGQLEPGVWRAAARLQTFSFCKSRAKGSPLSAAARCSLLPRAGELLQPTLAASSWEAGSSCGGRSCSTPPCAHSMRNKPGHPSFGNPWSQCMRLVIAGGRFLWESRDLDTPSHVIAIFWPHWVGWGGEGVNLVQIPFVSSSC